MPALSKYQSISLSLSLVKQKCDITDAAFDITLTGMLEDSAGYTADAPTVPVYRPFYIAANHIAQSTDYQNLKKAGSVEFTGMATAIESLLRYQASIDTQFALVVPLGMAAIVSVENDQFLLFLSAYQSGSVPTILDY